MNVLIEFAWWCLAALFFALLLALFLMPLWPGLVRRLVEPDWDEDA